MISWNSLCLPSLTAAALLISFVSPTQAQDTSQADVFLGETFNVMGSLTDKNARDVGSKCRAMGAKLASIQGVTEPMRLYLGSVIERCIFVRDEPRGIFGR